MADAQKSIYSESESESTASELSLSCESSPFEYGDNLSETDAEAELPEDPIIQAQIHPYQFEPYRTDSDDSDEDNEADNAQEDRLNNTTWCSCQNCVIMPSPRECVCCHEYERVNDVRTESPDKNCIIHHPGFQPVCLDVNVLQVAYYQYRQQYGERPEQNNERQRYTAYRQFVRWCWHFLGKEVRVVIPSCVVQKIRESFPNINGHYQGFHQTDSD